MAEAPDHCHRETASTATIITADAASYLYDFRKFPLGCGMALWLIRHAGSEDRIHLDQTDPASDVLDLQERRRLRTGARQASASAIR